MARNPISKNTDGFRFVPLPVGPGKFPWNSNFRLTAYENLHPRPFKSRSELIRW